MGFCFYADVVGMLNRLVGLGQRIADVARYRLAGAVIPTLRYPVLQFGYRSPRSVDDDGGSLGDRVSFNLEPPSRLRRTASMVDFWVAHWSPCTSRTTVACLPRDCTTIRLTSSPSRTTSNLGRGLGHGLMVASSR